ncbi:hypothetical protein CYMTET_48084 [Cymbomonas tetramitiformis]|uniref:OTU domain-containing protein n=1 Tax=Cymbomonas tetramitiformis TaxID=36881 RepID=A0AAE0EVC3_9CHLO|nr:hypothetical protein CYMTET_48084 [Cymbomonas tetramitiformis]
MQCRKICLCMYPTVLSACTGWGPIGSGRLLRSAPNQARGACGALPGAVPYAASSAVANQRPKGEQRRLKSWVGWVGVSRVGRCGAHYVGQVSMACSVMDGHPYADTPCTVLHVQAGLPQDLQGLGMQALPPIVGPAGTVGACVPDGLGEACLLVWAACCMATLGMVQKQCTTHKDTLFGLVNKVDLWAEAMGQLESPSPADSAGMTNRCAAVALGNREDNARSSWERVRSACKVNRITVHEGCDPTALGDALQLRIRLCHQKIQDCKAERARIAETFLYVKDCPRCTSRRREATRNAFVNFLTPSSLFSTRDWDPEDERRANCLRPGARYSVRVDWERAKAEYQGIWGKVLEHHHVSMQKAARVSGVGQFLPTPAVLLRNLGSWVQLWHTTDLLLRCAKDILPAIPTQFSSGMFLDEQSYTELLPDSAWHTHWQRCEDGAFHFTLDHAASGFPSATPLRRVRFAGPPGSVIVWPGDRTVHRGLCPVGEVPGGGCGLRTAATMSAILYGAISTQPGVPATNDQIRAEPLGTLSQYGMPWHLQCLACGDAIRFGGSYGSLPEVWSCDLCVQAGLPCDPLQGTDLQQPGLVMCGPCYDWRNQHAVGAPRVVHALHPSSTCPNFENMEGWSKMPPPEARLHATLKMSDLVLAWEVLEAFVGKKAWDARPEAEKVELARIRWIDGQADPPRVPARGGPLTFDGSADTQRTDTCLLYQRMGVHCPGLRSLVFGILKACRASNLAKVNNQLAGVLANRRKLTMDFALGVAVKLTHNFNGEFPNFSGREDAKKGGPQRSLLVRCDCSQQEGGDEPSPAMWGGRWEARPTAACRNAEGSRLAQPVCTPCMDPDRTGADDAATATSPTGTAEAQPRVWPSPQTPTATADSAAAEPMDTQADPNAATPASPDDAATATSPTGTAEAQPRVGPSHQTPTATADSAAAEPMDTQADPNAATPTSPGADDAATATSPTGTAEAQPRVWPSPQTPTATADSAAAEPMDTRAVPNAATPTSPGADDAPTATSPTGTAEEEEEEWPSPQTPTATADSAAAEPMDTRAVPNAATPTSPGADDAPTATSPTGTAEAQLGGWPSPQTEPMDTRAVPNAATATSPTGDAEPMDTRAVPNAATPTSPGVARMAEAKAVDPTGVQRGPFYDADNNHLLTRDHRGHIIDSAIDCSFGSVTEPGACQPAHRRQLVDVQAAPTGVIVTMADVQAYLRTAGLRAVDVEGDGNCWLHCVGWHLPQAEGAKRSLTGGGQVRVQNCRQAIQAFYEMHPEYYNFDMAETRGQQNAHGDWHYVSLSKILAQKRQYDEPEFWHIIANMTGRVIQLYISWPLAEQWPSASAPTPEDFPNNAPFAMEFICPHEGVVLTSREPLRLWKLLEHPYCAGHYMRILPDNE